MPGRSSGGCHRLSGIADPRRRRSRLGRARNLVVGPHNKLEGDIDGDGDFGGEAKRGLLPGEISEPGVLGDPGDNARLVAGVLEVRGRYRPCAGSTL